MANAGDLQAMLRTLGASRVKLDTIMRQLRAQRLLPVDGHGPSAASLGPVHAARVLIANAGSTKAVHGSDRLAALAMLTNAKGVTLLDAITAELSGSVVTLDEVRVSRRSEFAVLETVAGEQVFVGGGYDRAADHIRTEGIISGHALDQVRALLAVSSPAQRRRQRRRRKKV